MRAVVQRADGARVRVSGDVVAEFEGPGLVVLVGITRSDTLSDAHRLATKVHQLRIFEPRHAPLGGAQAAQELSAAELDLPIMVVSQFTLYGDARTGRRPTWTAAAPRDVAEPLVDAVVVELRRRGARVVTGVFGADMAVDLTNDGPMTVLLHVGADA